jgi:hypothetical protein
MSKKKDSNPQPVDKHNVSLNAYRRILLLHDQQIAAAKRIGSADGYSDFFIEAPGKSWQEAFADSDSVSLVAKLGKASAARRMAHVRELRRQNGLNEDDSYHDYFSDGPDPNPGPDWNETWTEKSEAGRPTTEQLLVDPGARLRALSQLKVVQAFLRMRERSALK